MIIDVNVDVTAHLPALAKAGVTDIIGYLNPHGTTSKVITPARTKAIADARMSLTLVSEGWGDFAHGDISAAAGTRDAQHALAALRELGTIGVGNPCVYFAVDTDASTTQIMSLVMPYFKAIRVAFDASAFKARVGVYASGAVCNAALAAGYANLAWLAAPGKWLGSAEFLASKKWVLHQGLPTKVAGVDCDIDTPNGEDWGQFIPFSDAQIAASSAPSAKSIEEAQMQIAARVANAPSLHDRQLDAATTAIQAILANGVHSLAAGLAEMGLVIPSGASAKMANVLGRAAIEAILAVKEDEK
jgi:hypothetical protein